MRNRQIKSTYFIDGSSKIELSRHINSICIHGRFFGASQPFLYDCILSRQTIKKKARKYLTRFIGGQRSRIMRICRAYLCSCYKHAHKKPFGVWTSQIFASVLTSLITVVAINVDLFNHIVNPYKYDSETGIRKLLFTHCFSWCFIVLLCGVCMYVLSVWKHFYILEFLRICI